MQLILNIVILVLGFALLIKGADIFVDGAVEVSRRLKIPPVVVGLTVVSFGTSAPELAVSVAAAVSGNNGIAAGNVVGSNIFNLMVVAGLSAVFTKLPVSESIVKKDYPFMIAVSLAALCLFFDGDGSRISRGDGLILLLFFAIFIVYTVQGALSSHRSSEAEGQPESSMSGLKCALFIVLGIIAIASGGQFSVKAASYIASAFGMSDTLIGLTIVALGTSLPELVTSVVAARKGENDISIGNVIGSNIFNICFVLGLSTAISPISVSTDIVIDTAIMICFCLLAAFPIIGKRAVSRGWGVVMVSGYVLYLAYIIMRNYGIWIF